MTIPADGMAMDEDDPRAADDYPPRSGADLHNALCHLLVKKFGNPTDLELRICEVDADAIIRLLADPAYLRSVLDATGADVVRMASTYSGFDQFVWSAPIAFGPFGAS